MKKIKSELLFADQTHDATDTLSDSEMFTFPCGDGCLWGQVMRPDGGFGEGRPCVIFLHGFPGGNRNDDFPAGGFLRGNGNGILAVEDAAVSLLRGPMAAGA